MWPPGHCPLQTTLKAEFHKLANITSKVMPDFKPMQVNDSSIIKDAACQAAIL